MTDIRTLSCDAFTPHVGSAITLITEDGQSLDTTLRIARINPNGTFSNAPREAFSLLLYAPEPCAWNSCDATLNHPQLGSIGPVHVVRIVSDEPGISAVFQASFN